MTFEQRHHAPRLVIENAGNRRPFGEHVMSKAKKILFIISNSETAFWLSEVTHPYWHLIERGVEVDFASPKGGKVVYDPYRSALQGFHREGRYRQQGLSLGQGVGRQIRDDLEAQ
jgi:hypothetical protein